MSQRFGGVEQKRYHQDSQNQRVDVRRYVQRLAVQEDQRGSGPDQTEHRGQLHDVLFGQMVSGVQLEDEHVINAGRTPAVHVDAHQEKKYDQQQWTPVQPDHDTPVRVAVAVGYAWNPNIVYFKQT